MVFTISNYKVLKSFLLVLFLILSISVHGSVVLLNSSYDTGRELFVALNASFVEHWKRDHPKDHVVIRQSHAASTKQAMTVLQGLDADVVTYNQVTDVQILHDRGNLIPSDWKERLPNNSSPFYSTIAFVVRKGNPKKIYNWYDLISENVKIILPNPKTSGNGRYIYLAALGVISQIVNLDEVKVRSWMVKFFRNVLIFDLGSRSATSTFIDRKQGDVLITFEAEANVICRKYHSSNFEVIVPKKNILAEFPVAWIDDNIRKHGTEGIAKDYLRYFYTLEAQRIIANFYYRVNVVSIMKEYSDYFPEVHLFRVEERFSDWNKVMNVHFSRGGELDKLLAMRYNV